MTDVVGRGTIELVADARKLKAGIEDAKKSVRTLGEGQREISKSAQRSIDSYIGRLQVQNQTIGKSVRETELFKLAVRGASNEQIKSADAALRGIELQNKSIAAAAAAQQRLQRLTSLGRTAAIAAAAALALFGRSAIKSAADLDDMAERTGASVENLSKLAQQALISGTQIGTVETAMVQLTKRIGGAAEESQEATRALAALGLEASKLRNLDTADALKLVADRMNDFADGGGKTAAAIALFGKSGAQVLPFLKDLANDQALAARVTAEQAAQSEELEKNIRRLGNEAKVTGESIALKLVPGLLKYAQAANDANRVGLDFVARLQAGNPFVGVGQRLSETRKSLSDAILKNDEAEIKKMQVRLEFWKALQAREAIERGKALGGDTPGERARFGVGQNNKPALDFAGAAEVVQRLAKIRKDANLAELNDVREIAKQRFGNAAAIEAAERSLARVQEAADAESLAGIARIASAESALLEARRKGLDETFRKTRAITLAEEVAIKTKAREEFGGSIARAVAIRQIERETAKERLGIANSYFADLKKLENDYLSIAQRNRKQIAENDKAVSDQLKRSAGIQQDVATAKLPPDQQIDAKRRQADDVESQLSFAATSGNVKEAIVLHEKLISLRRELAEAGQHVDFARPDDLLKLARDASKLKLTDGVKEAETAVVSLGTKIADVRTDIQALQNTVLKVNIGVTDEGMQEVIDSVRTKLEAEEFKINVIANIIQRDGNSFTNIGTPQPKAYGGLVAAAMARGGTVPGSSPGPRSDNILIAATAGEYVIQRPAVQHYGTDLLNAINSMRLQKHADGGQVGGGGSSPATAERPADMVVDLRSNGQPVGRLTGPRDRVQQFIDDFYDMART